jgi:hypothetical protein
MKIRDYIALLDAEDFQRVGIYDRDMGQPITDGTVTEIMESQYADREIKTVNASWLYREIWLTV